MTSWAQKTNNLTREPAVNNAGFVYQVYLPTGGYSPSQNPSSYMSNGEAKPIEPGVFGNFNGLTNERLEYIRKVGADSVWLSPVYQSDPEQPGFTYNATDYHKVNPLFGSEQEFQQMVERAHAHGLAVVLDQVFNHTAKKHPWFEASSNPEHPEHGIYKDYYVWADPIKVGAKDATMVEFASAYRDDKAIDELARDAATNASNAKDVLPSLQPALFDSQNQPVFQKHLIDGEWTTLSEPATVKIYPVSDYSKPILLNPDRPVSPDNVLIDSSGNWLFHPMRDAEGKILYPPNNFVAPNGDRTWDFDARRQQLYLHSFHDSMPDLNIGNPAVNNELIAAGKHWIENFGVDGFRIDASRHASSHALLQQSDAAQRDAALTEHFPETETFSPLQKQLRIAGLTSNPPNTLRGLFKDENWENPAPTQRLLKEIHQLFPATRDMNMEDMLLYVGSLKTDEMGAIESGNLFSGFRGFLHPRDIVQPAGLAFWSEFAEAMRQAKAQTDKGTFRILHELGDDPLGGGLCLKDGAGGDYGYFSTFDNVRSIRQIQTAVQDMLDSMPNGERVNWTLDNHDTQRFFTRMGLDLAETGELSAEQKVQSQKMLLAFLSRLPGNISVYNGTELGLGSPYGREIQQDASRDPLQYFNNFTAGNPDARNHDYARAAFPFSPEDFDSANLMGGQGRFFRTPESWKGRSAQEQVEDRQSVMHGFAAAMRQRVNDEVLSQTGEMHFAALSHEVLRPVAGETSQTLGEVDKVMVYSRSNGTQSRLFIDNYNTLPIVLDVGNLLKANPDLPGLAAFARNMEAEITLEPLSSFNPLARLQQPENSRSRGV